MVGPLLLILVIGGVVKAGGLDTTDAGLLNYLLIILLIVTVVDLGIIVYTQTSPRFLASLAKRACWAIPP